MYSRARSFKYNKTFKVYSQGNTLRMDADKWRIKGKLKNGNFMKAFLKTLNLETYKYVV